MDLYKTPHPQPAYKREKKYVTGLITLLPLRHFETVSALYIQQALADMSQ